MIIIRPFRPLDMTAIEVQAAQVQIGEGHLLTLAQGMDYAAHGPAVSITRGTDGPLLCLAGLRQSYGHYATAWCVMADGKRNDFVAITRACRTMLDFHPHYTRVDTLVHVDFEAGHRWAQLLGFLPVHVMRHAAPDGGDLMLYELKRGGT
jgi:hypothetical protein